MRGAGPAASPPHPGKRSPLWHQRQRAAQLLDVARKYPDFPIVLETVRECLQDVYDVPTLRELMNRIAQRRIRIARSRDQTPSPFAASLLFGYVGAFMYEGDSPLAERRAAALSLDSVLLAELLGRVELRELLDPRVIEPTVRSCSTWPRRGGARCRGGRRPAAAARSADRGRDRAAVHRGGRRRLAEGLRAARRALTVYVRRRRPGGSPSRTWDCCATASASRCPSVFPPASRVRWPTPSASCSAATPAPTARSPPTTPPRDSGSGVRVTADVLGRMAADHKLVRGEFTVRLRTVV